VEAAAAMEAAHSRGCRCGRESKADEGRCQDRNQGSHGISPLKGVAPSRSSLVINPQKRGSFSQYGKEI
jgi:hypothetical protein